MFAWFCVVVGVGWIIALRSGNMLIVIVLLFVCFIMF